jgi:hypothetical protein
MHPIFWKLILVGSYIVAIILFNIKLLNKNLLNKTEFSLDYS